MVTLLTLQLQKIVKNNISSPFAFLGLILATLTGCSVALEDRSASWAKRQKGPITPAFSMRTDFSKSLACMDHLLYNLGYDTMPVFVENISDNSGKMRVGARNMMITALTKMSSRSNAFQIFTYGLEDSRNLITLFANAGRADPYLNIPALTIKGSITQYDKSVDMRQFGANLALSDIKVDRTTDNEEVKLVNQAIEVTSGIGGSSRADLLGLDLMMIKSYDMTVIPGVYSNNAVVLLSYGRSNNVEAVIKKKGFNLRYSYDRSDAPAQSFRNLIELSAIELTGRLYKLPYWTCLSINPNLAEVQNEILDWYYDIRDQGKLVSYLKLHFAFMGKFNGPINEIATPKFMKVIRTYLAEDWVLDEQKDIPSGVFQAVVSDFVLWYRGADSNAVNKEKLRNKNMIKNSNLIINNNEE